jgi:predicted RNA-binding protein with PUA-like domain
MDPTGGPKEFVLCFDGTNNKFHGDSSDSNVLKIFRVSPVCSVNSPDLLEKDARSDYHQPVSLLSTWYWHVCDFSLTFT